MAEFHLGKPFYHLRVVRILLGHVMAAKSNCARSLYFGCTFHPTGTRRYQTGN